MSLKLIVKRSIPLLLFVVQATNTVYPAEKIWTTSSFLDFVGGELQDGGVNTYVTADGTVRLINLWDLNNDGNFDLPIACAQDHDEETETFIYWADEGGFAPQRRGEIPTDGAIGAAAADLNADGHVDLVLVNRFDGNTTDLDGYICWGSHQGFDVSRRTNLPGKSANAVAIADLNGDGHLDIVIANKGVDYHMTVDNFQQSFIYWGSEDGYSSGRRSALRTINCSDVVISDVNHDSHLDIVFANEGNDDSQSGVVIYLGNGHGGFSDDHTLHLPGMYTSGVHVTDLNADGYVEVILANMYRLAGKPDPPSGNRVETYRVNSYIYWGSPNGFAVKERTELPTVGALAVDAGDLNGDHRPDLVFANSAVSHSSIYWNGPDGFSSKHRTSISANQAHDVAIADLDQNGHSELVFANYASGGFFDTKSFIYWGTADGFRSQDRTELPTSGASAIVIEDLNGDRRTDVVFVNKIEGVSYPGGTTTAVADLGPTKSFIYWGDQHGRLDPVRRQELPTIRNADGHVNSDLNADGYVDVLFAHFGSPTVIYWNGPQGFHPQNKSPLPYGEAPTGRTADLDRDGYLDLLLKDSVFYGQKTGFSEQNRFEFDAGEMKPTVADLNHDGWLEVIAPMLGRVVIYWNGPSGFNKRRTTELSVPGKRAQMAEVVDLNRDTFLDLIVVNLLDYDKPIAPGEVMVLHGNPNVDASVFWGGENGYSEQRQLRLPTIGPTDVVAADFNVDGFVDIFIPSYFGGHHRDFPGRLFWNGPDGFHAQRRTEIPGHSGCGVLAADINQDGYPELIVANHTNVGNHRSPVWVHWGSADGFDKNHRTSLPATGVHYFSLVDVGNVYDRSDQYGYVSAAFDAGQPVMLKQISWEAETPFRTRVKLQIRTATTKVDLAAANWHGEMGPNTFFETQETRVPESLGVHRWIQYKATLEAPSCINTPVLQSVSIVYDE